MRKSIISSLIATVVAVANDRLVAAGVVAGAGLHRNRMREHLGNWHEPMFASVEPCYQSTDMSSGTRRLNWGQGRDTTPSLNQTSSTRLPSLLGKVIDFASRLMQRSDKRSMQHAFAYCPAYAALAQVAHKG